MVMGGDSCSEGFGFESQHRIQCFTMFCCKMFIGKRLSIKPKRGREVINCSTSAPSLNTSLQFCRTRRGSSSSNKVPNTIEGFWKRRKDLTGIHFKVGQTHLATFFNLKDGVNIILITTYLHIFNAIECLSI